MTKISGFIDADGHVVTCPFESLGTVAGALEEKLGEPRTVKAIWKPNLSTQVDEENAQSILKMMAALEFVDYVTWFEEAEPCALIETVCPHVDVNWAEYGERCVDAKTVQACGARLHIVDLVAGLSTSAIIRKIQQCEK